MLKIEKIFAFLFLVAIASGVATEFVAGAVRNIVFMFHCFSALVAAGMFAYLDSFDW